MVTYTMIERAGKRWEQLAYRMAEYVVTDEAEKLADTWRGRKTSNLATEAEHMGEISVLNTFDHILGLKTIKLLFGG